MTIETAKNLKKGDIVYRIADQNSDMSQKYKEWEILENYDDGTFLAQNDYAVPHILTIDELI